MEDQEFSAEHEKIGNDADDEETTRETLRSSAGPMLIEKIIRERIYDSPYWRQHCHSLTAASLMEKLYDTTHAVGGCVAISGSAPSPTPFLCLALRLLHLRPELDIVKVYIEQEEFKYLRALGAFYLRLVAVSSGEASGVLIYKYLEPLMQDARKLRLHNADGSASLGYMDVFIDQLLTEERVCDTSLPRLTRRDILEDNGYLEPRVSPLSYMLEEDQEDGGAIEELDVEESFESLDLLKNTKNRLKLKSNKKKHAGTVLNDDQQNSIGVSGGGGGKEEMSIEETNKMRAALGMKPLKT